jgi:hypothetical protein
MAGQELASNGGLQMFRFVVAALALSAAMLSAQACLADGAYSLTMFVEEGSPNGHVFLGISDGVHEQRWGWYTAGTTTGQKALGLIGCGGGQLKDDSRTRVDVYKKVAITQDGYNTVIAHIITRGSQGAAGVVSWSPFNHCGDWVADVAAAAGVTDVPTAGITGVEYDRPGQFEDYLLAHGGLRNLAGAWFNVAAETAPPWVIRQTLEGHVLVDYRGGPGHEALTGHFEGDMHANGDAWLISGTDIVREGSVSAASGMVIKVPIQGWDDKITWEVCRANKFDGESDEDFQAHHCSQGTMERH